MFITMQMNLIPTDLVLISIGLWIITETFQWSQIVGYLLAMHNKFKVFKSGEGKSHTNT